MAEFTFACPICRGPLVARDPAALFCPVDDRLFPRIDGIWRFLPPERQAHYAPFVEEYEAIRRREGRGSRLAAYYRQLPFADLTGRHSEAWRERARSYTCLLRRVIVPLEERHGRPLRLLDLGAGNGWLSARLAGRGHRVAAVDLLANDWDGLGAHRHFKVSFLPIQAEFDRLPLAAGEVDLAIFNASLHYAAGFEPALAEAFRVTAGGGAVAVVDTPLYRDPASGAAMVAERAAAFTRLAGFDGAALPHANYLTEERLAALERSLQITARLFSPLPGWRRAARRLKVAWKRQREPARFPVILLQPAEGG